MTIIDTYNGTICFCKVKAIERASSTQTFPDKSVSFKLSSLHILENEMKQKYLETTFTANGPWHGFTIFLNFHEEGHLEGELNYLQCQQAPGLIVAEYIQTENGYYIFGYMKTLGEKVREGIIINAINNPLLVTENGLSVENLQANEENDNDDLEDIDDESEDEYTDLIRQFVRIKGEELFICCQSFAIYILSRLGYKITFQNSKGVQSMLIYQKGKEEEICILPSLANRTWHPKINTLKRNTKYILMDIHYSLPLPDVFIFKGVHLIKKLQRFPTISIKDPEMIRIRNVWDLLLDESIPF